MPDDICQSPATSAFTEAFTPMQVKRPETAPLTPTPTVAPNNAAGEGRTRNHQVVTSPFPPTKQYRIVQQAAQLSVHAGLPLQTLWTFDGKSPGPLYVARYGEPIIVRNVNALPANNGGFGKNQVSTHGANIWVTNNQSNTVTELQAFDGSNIWVANFISRNLVQLASNGAVVNTVTVGDGAAGVIYAGGCLWVANNGSNTVSKIQQGLVVGTFAVSRGPFGVAFDGASIWVASSGAGTVRASVRRTKPLPFPEFNRRTFCRWPQLI